MKMNITKIRQYKKQGKTVYVYAVKGSKESLKAYKTSQGKFFREEKDGTPVWFSTLFAGENGILMQSAKGKWFADMSKFEQAQSLVEQFSGGAFGAALAKEVVGQLLGSPIPNVANEAEEPKAIKAPQNAEGLDKL